MARAFIENGVWRIPPASRMDVQVQGRATVRVSVVAALATLAIAAMQDGGGVSGPLSKPSVIAQPEVVIIKTEERVPSMASPVSPFRRRAAAPVAVEATLAASTEITATARAMPSAREVEVVEAGMIRAGGETYRLAGIVLPGTDRTCRRLDGLAVGCLDRAQSYLQLLVKGRAVACERAPQRSDGPPDANCRVGDADLAEQLVRQGWARAGDQPEERFVMAEAAARKQKLGIWRD